MYPTFYEFENSQQWMTTLPIYTSNSQYGEAEAIDDEAQPFSPYVLAVAWIVLCVAVLTVAFINHQTMLSENLSERPCVDSQMAYITGDSEQALSLINQCVAENPKDLQHRGLRSSIHFTLGNMQSSYEDYLYVLERSPDDEQFRTLLYPDVTTTVHHKRTVGESDAMNQQMLDLDYEIIYPGQSCSQMYNCPLNGRIWSLLTYSYGVDVSYIVFPDYLPASGNEELALYEGCLPMPASVYQVGHETVRPTACLLDVYGNLIIVTEENRNFDVVYPLDDCSNDLCVIPTSLHANLAQLYGNEVIFMIFEDVKCFPPSIFTNDYGEALSCIVDSDGDVIVVVDPTDNF